MKLSDFSKDVQRLLLAHWTPNELADRLENPEYFFEQVVVPRLNYLKLQGEDVPRLRLKVTPTGEFQVILNA